MSFNNNFIMEATEANKPIFTTASETMATSTPSYVSEGQSLFSPLAAPFRMRESSDMMNLMQQEPRVGDIAPAAIHMDNEMLMNFRNSGPEAALPDMDHARANTAYFIGGAREESVTSHIWGEESSASTSSGSRNDEMNDTFDFLAKSLSSANSYVSMLTREQLAVLRAFRPSVLYSFLQEVAKVRSDKRLRRAGPNECAFCKNNGENEECYSSHALKDWRGRVLCPVLRAFRCPRCGATGDRAHTIKYCPEQADNAGLERSGSFVRRRAGSSSTLLFDQMPQATPMPPYRPPLPALLHHGTLTSIKQSPSTIKQGLIFENNPYVIPVAIGQIVSL